MTGADREGAEEPATVGADATRVAAGGGVALVGGLVGRALRLLNTWLLSTALGPVAFGLYATAFTIANLINVLIQAGLQTGTVFYAARYRASGERDRLKGTLLAAVAVVSTWGLFVTGLVEVAARYFPERFTSPDLAAAVAVVAPAAAMQAFLRVWIGSLQAAKDMRSSTLAFDVAAPAGGVVAAGLVLALGGGVTGVLWAYVFSYAVAILVAVWRAWGHYGALLLDRTVKPVYELRALLAQSIPQSFADVLFRVNTWVDVLMLTSMRSFEEVAIYKIATSVALIGLVPANAMNAMFRPVVAELVYTHQTVRLDALLKAITRWLVLLVTLPFVIVLLLPDLVLVVFRPEYLAAANALGILVVGQAIYVSCAPSANVLSMAGHPRRELFNAGAALAINLPLNVILIPRLGIEGAAIASSLSLVVWTLGRVIQARQLVGVTPFSGRTVVLLAPVVVAAILGVTVLRGSPLAWRAGAAAAVVLSYAVLVRVMGASPEDAILLARVRSKLKRGKV